MHQNLFRINSSADIKNALLLAGRILVRGKSNDGRMRCGNTSNRLVCGTRRPTFQPIPQSLLDGLRRSLGTGIDDSIERPDLLVSHRAYGTR